MAASFEMIRADSLFGTKIFYINNANNVKNFRSTYWELKLSSLNGRFCTERMGSRGTGMELEGETERGE